MILSYQYLSLFKNGLSFYSDKSLNIPYVVLASVSTRGPLRQARRLHPMVFISKFPASPACRNDCNLCRARLKRSEPRERNEESSGGVAGFAVFNVALAYGNSGG